MDAIFSPYDYHMDLCNELVFVCLDAWPTSFLHDRKLSVGITCKLFNQLFFMPAMLVGTIDFCRLIPFSLTLPLPGNDKVNANKTFWPHFFAHFSID